jgi:carboxymethylenebutenolidase
MGFHVEIDSIHGGSFRGYEAPVADDSCVGAVLIVHEWFGLNDGMREEADRFAAVGFHALAVDLFAGMVASDAETARRLAAEMKTQHAMQVITAATEYVRRRPNSTGKVGLAGFGLGGAVALAAASQVNGVSAAVTFCGLPPQRHTDVARINAPVMGHYGLRDPVVPIAEPQAVFAALSAAGKRASLHTYEAGHAFMRSSSKSYHGPMAELAWKRTVGLFREELQ